MVGATRRKTPISLSALDKIYCLLISGASQVALVVKNLPTNAGDVRDAGSISESEDLWRRAWQLTPVFLLGESHRQRSLTGYGP